MEELTESARQCLVSQGIIIGTLSVLDSLGLLLTGIVVITRANDLLHFTSLTHLAILEIVCGLTSLLAVAYVCWVVAAYRNRQLEIRSKYLDENMSRGLLALIPPLILTFSALVVSAIFLMLKTESNSSYDLKSAMSLYSTDMTRKVIVDRIQIILECCGSQSLLDWFLVDWQDTDVEPGVHVQNASFSDWDSVPFSCCSAEAPPPCIHHQLRVFGVDSLYTSGCADKLDEAVFIFVVLAVVMLFVSTFFMMIILYSSRKLQTSARSAVIKGDATAPGSWWLLSPTATSRTHLSDDHTPLLELPRHNKLHRKDSFLAAEYRGKQSGVIMSPVLVTQRSRKRKELENASFAQAQNRFLLRDKTILEEWESLKTGSKNLDGESSEDWTRRACDASGSTSSTSFLTSTRNFNSTPETRHSVSDTAVANLEVSRHLEHNVRPLFRS